jgi:uncharacterized protein
MDLQMNRRDFVRLAAGGAALAGSSLAAAEQTGEIPRRALGKTGVSVPILGFGTASTGIRRDLKNAASLFTEALSLGINYFDAAPEFSGYGIAQKQVGHALSGRRKEIFLTTKCLRPTSDALLKLLAANLKELRTDHVDLLYLHSLGSEPQMPLAQILRKSGAFEGLLKAKREGLTRFIGVTGHHRPMKFVQLLKAREIDAMMNAVNFVDRHTYGFEEKVWPVARKKNVGLVAMKVFGGALFGGAANHQMSNSKLDVAYHDLAFRYALSQPGVACAVIGMATRDELHENVDRARRFAALTAQESENAVALGKSLASSWGAHFGAVT